LNEKA